jgi:hypothetical protein
MKHLDLFSGIGGGALAVEAVWPDAEHIFCEIDPFCQAVLRKHWPDSEIHGDINDYIQELTGMPAMEYIERNGLSKKREVQRSSEDVRTGTFDRRDSGLFPNNSAGDVVGAETARGEVPIEHSEGKGKSVLPNLTR